MSIFTNSFAGLGYRFNDKLFELFSILLDPQKGYGQDDDWVVKDPIVHSTPPNTQSEILKEKLDDPVLYLSLAW